jgi:hypothetical protein
MMNISIFKNANTGIVIVLPIKPLEIKYCVDLAYLGIRKIVTSEKGTRYHMRTFVLRRYYSKNRRDIIKDRNRRWRTLCYGKPTLQQ